MIINDITCAEVSKIYNTPLLYMISHAGLGYMSSTSSTMGTIIEPIPASSGLAGDKLLN